jgi:Fe2+ or Zn2+ uptake regulation protein
MTAEPVAGLHAAVARRLAAIHQRYTSGRRRLVDALESAGRPVTVSELVGGTAGGGHRRLPASTTYRNLAVLEQAEVVRRIQLGDEFARFELSEALTGHHHHLVCSRCGGVEDVSPSPKLERIVAETIAAIESETGFRPESHRLDLVGQCAACS